MKKQCYFCKEYKDIDKFWRNKRTKAGIGMLGDDISLIIERLSKYNLI